MLEITKLKQELEDTNESYKEQLRQMELQNKQ